MVVQAMVGIEDFVDGIQFYILIDEAVISKYFVWGNAAVREQIHLLRHKLRLHYKFADKKTPSWFMKRGFWQFVHGHLLVWVSAFLFFINHLS